MCNDQYGLGSGLRLITTAACIAVIAGCAAAPARWIHPDRPKDTVEADLGYCETVAKSQTSRPVAPPPSVNFYGLASVFRMMSESGLDRDYQAEIDRQVVECLQKKGWRRAQ